jgi:hypothetical protein
MKTQHTPGPWKLLHHTCPQHDGDRAIYGLGDKWIADMNGGTNDDSEVLANARLISVAPEMIDTLKKLSKNYGMEIASIVLPIIRKAEGE